MLEIEGPLATKKMILETIAWNRYQAYFKIRFDFIHPTVEKSTVFNQRQNRV